MRLLFAGVLIGLLCHAGAPASAQVATRSGWGDLDVGGEVEQYLRYLGTGGVSGPSAWSIRGFGPAGAERLWPTDEAHPWSHRYDFRVAEDSVAAEIHLLRPELSIAHNSAFPYGGNDGPRWTGRGLNVSGSAGLAARWGVLSARVAPIAFWAQNRNFPLAPHVEQEVYPFADAVLPAYIDLPQRFGDGAFARVDPGQSMVRADLRGMVVGFSTANEVWGPASEYPLVLSANAPGFPHLFVGTGTPWELGAVRVQARVAWGALQQSEYAAVVADSGKTRMSGLVAVVEPIFIPGLEVGLTRFFHSPERRARLSWEYWGKPFEGVFKKGLRDAGGVDGKSDIDNQLASVFFRWVLPRSGFEFYGEYAREDHNWDLGDFLREPDNGRAYMAGLRKLWTNSPETFVALRAELMNAQEPAVSPIRGYLPFYVHTVLRQGHTHRGQLLGATAGYWGAGSVLAVDRYTSRGRWTASWSRQARRQPWNVMHSLGVDGLVFRGRLDITGGAKAVLERNRFPAGNSFNLHTSLGVRAAVH